jgi:hypothetical protein
MKKKAAAKLVKRLNLQKHRDAELKRRAKEKKNKLLSENGKR